MNKIISYSTVFFQFLFIALIIHNGGWLAKNSLWLLVEISGIMIGLWAIFAMQIGNFNITPDVKQTGKFVEKGPYGYVRHPMYTAVLLTTFGLAADQPSAYRLILWGLLLITLLVKLTHEEKLLTQHFPEYRGYRDRTRRLIPYLF